MESNRFLFLANRPSLHHTYEWAIPIKHTEVANYERFARNVGLPAYWQLTVMTGRPMLARDREVTGAGAEYNRLSPVKGGRAAVALTAISPPRVSSCVKILNHTHTQY